MKKSIIPAIALSMAISLSPAYAAIPVEDLNMPGDLGNKKIFSMPTDDQLQITILGDAVATPEQMVSFILANNPNPQLNDVSLEDLVNCYYAEAKMEGIRADVALCQALKETNFFAYGDEIEPEQNNFCGLGRGAANDMAYFSFSSPAEGVRAHIQHLAAYASKDPLHTELVDPRYETLVTRYPQYHGTINYWVGLNGRWSVPGIHYGQDILNLWREAISVKA